MSETKTERKSGGLLSKCSELEKERKELASDLGELILSMLNNSDSQRCNELKDNFNKKFTRKDNVLNKAWDLFEIMEERGKENDEKIQEIKKGLYLSTILAATFGYFTS